MFTVKATIVQIRIFYRTSKLLHNLANLSLTLVQVAKSVVYGRKWCTNVENFGFIKQTWNICDCMSIDLTNPV